MDFRPEDIGLYDLHMDFLLEDIGRTAQTWPLDRDVGRKNIEFSKGRLSKNQMIGSNWKKVPMEDI